MTTYIVYLIIGFFSLETCPKAEVIFLAPDNCNFFYQQENALTIQKSFETFAEAEACFELLREDVSKTSNITIVYQLSIYDSKWYNFDGSHKTICQEMNFIDED